MSFTIPSFAEIRDRYLQAVINLQPTAATGPDSDHYIRATSLAVVLEDLYAHQAWVARQALPDTADADIMERMANQRGLTRKAAALASGTITFSGVNGTVIPAGMVSATAAGLSFQTTASATIASGSATVAAAAAVAGAAGSVATGTQLMVQSPPPGVDGAAVVASMSGGLDAESDAALLARLLLTLGSPPQGGAAADYQQWALAVPGVARAYVFSIRRGLGTVDVVPMPAVGLPDAALIAAVQAYIDARKPLGLGATGLAVLAPSPIVTPVTATMTLSAGVTLASISAALNAAVKREFDALAPGDTLYRSQLIAALIDVDGVRNVVLTAPAADVTGLVDVNNLQLVTMGTVTLT